MQQQQQKLSLSEVIKARGRIINSNRHDANYNDIIDERYEHERREIKKNLHKLDHLIKSEPKVFEFSFKRSLANHINERKRLEEMELENQLRKQQQQEIEERSERLKKLKDI